MRLDTATIHGFLRFENTLEIDFRTLPAGLIAFVGPIGEGKTTALETPLAVLFRQLLSRQGALVDYALARDSFLEAQFTIEGRGTFRARVNLDGVKRGQDAVIVPVLPDGTEGEPLNDGKVSSYDAIIAGLFPSLQLLRASAVISQDRQGSFADLDTKGRKALFGEMIGTGHYQQMSDTARVAANMVESARGRMMAVRDTLARDTTPDILQTIEADGQSLVADTTRVLLLRTELQERMTRLETELLGLQAQAGKHQAAIITRQATQPALEQAERDHERARQGLEAATQQYQDDLDAMVEKLQQTVGRLDVQLADPESLNGALCGIDADLGVALARLEAWAVETATLAKELQDIHDVLQTQQRDVDVRLANNRGILQQADDIRAAAVMKAEVEDQVAALRLREAALRVTVRDAQTRLNDTLTRLVQIDVAAGELKHRERAVATLSGVPCGGVDPFGTCRFLIDAKAAESQIHGLRTTVSARGAWTRQRDEQDADRVLAERALREMSAHIHDLEQQIAAASAKAKMLTTVETAEIRIEDLQQQHILNKQTADTAKANVLVREEARQADIAARTRSAMVDADCRREDARTTEQAHQAELHTRREVAQTDADLELARVTGRYEERRDNLRMQLANLDRVVTRQRAELLAAEQDEHNFVGAALRATELHGELAGDRRRWDDSTTQLATLQAEQLAVTRRRRDFDARQAELEDLLGRLEQLTDEQLEWNLLTKGLGRDGLQTLEIDAAGPTVSTFTNELLSVCFGARFSVDLVTQEATADGKGLKESFQIKVYDNERGGHARDLGALSGGEKVIVGEALANAIALYNNTRNGLQIQTLFRDETTGSLDPETAPLYVAMLRKVQQLGDVRQIFYVTHSPVAAALADAQIQFAGGTATIAWPPFREAA